MQIQTNETVNEPTKAPNNLKLLTLILLMIALLSVGAYFIMDRIFQAKLSFVTIETINGVNVAGMDMDEAISALMFTYQEHQPFVMVVAPEDEIKCDAALLGFQIDEQLLESDIKSLMGRQSIFSIGTTTDKNTMIEVVYNFEEDLLLTKVNELRNLLNPQDQPVIKTQDACITYNKDNGKFEVSEALFGNMEDAENGLGALTAYLADIGAATAYNNVYQNSVSPLLSVPLAETGWITKPNVVAEQLAQDCQMLNERFIEITTMINGQPSEVLTPPQYVQVFNISIDDKVTYPPLDALVVNESAVDDLTSHTGRKVNSLGVPRNFTTTNGNTIPLTQGDYGWWMHYSDTRQNFLTVFNSMIEKAPDLNPAVDIVFRQTARHIYDSEAENPVNDYGNSYVEISLAAQHLWYYVDGALFLESDIVSGNPNYGQATPPGIYAVTYTERDAILTGENYRTPVKFWMPFNKDVGLHDATWQPVFGGTRYLTHGSNGCINLPYDIAEKMFGQLKRHDPVILY